MQKKDTLTMATIGQQPFLHFVCVRKPIFQYVGKKLSIQKVSVTAFRFKGYTKIDS